MPAQPPRTIQPADGELWTANYSHPTEFGGWQYWAAGPMVQQPDDHPIPSLRGALTLGELTIREHAPWESTYAGTLTSATGWTLAPDDVAPVLVARPVDPEDWPRDVMDSVRRGSRVRVEWVMVGRHGMRHVVEGAYRPRRWSLGGVDIGGEFLGTFATITAVDVVREAPKRWWLR
jgi:hypothetical protein